MKNILLIGAILLQALLAGCAAPGRPDPWPSLYDQHEYYWHAPQRMASADEAIGAIKNLQQSLVTWSGGKLDRLDVDQYGLFASGNAVAQPLAQARAAKRLKSARPEAAPAPREESFVISFDTLEMLTLARFPEMNRQYEWGVIAKYQGTAPVQTLRVRSREEATRLIAALETLAAARGYKFVSDLGLFGAPLTAAQDEALGLPPATGMLLTLVYRDGPGEKAGLRTGDVIVSIGKDAINNKAVFAKVYAGRKDWRLFRRDESGDYRQVVYRIDFPRGGGTTAVQQAEDHWFLPKRMASAEQAVGTIKNQQQDIAGATGWHVDELEVDQFGLRAKGKDALAIVPFEEVNRMAVQRYKAQKEFAWGLVVIFGTERQPVLLRTSSEKVARRLGDAIGTLAMERGARVLGGAGMRLRDATADDRGAVDLEDEYGVVVESVFVGGPAEKAGVRAGDLIVEVGRQRAEKMAEVVQKVLGADAEAKPLTLKLLRLEGDTIYEYVVKLKLGARNQAPAEDVDDGE